LSKEVKNMAGQTRVRIALVWKGKTQRWLSEQTGIHEVTISEILNGRTNPNDREKEAIAAALHMPQDRLFMEVSVAEASGFFFGNTQAEELYLQRMRRTGRREE
jgi:transcriptional regulator with XRE-family HTH domain